jgi:hypothetical protein
MTLLAIILYVFNRRKPMYFEEPLYRRAALWYIPNPFWDLNNPDTGPEWYHLPKSWGLGFFFATMPEMFLSWLDDKAPGGKDLLDEAYDAFIPNFVPTAVQAVRHWVTNRDAFGRPIVPRGQEGLEKEYQYGRYTPALWKELGKQIDESPAKLHRLWRDLTGNVGAWIEEGASKGTELAKGKEGPPEPERGVSEMPLIRRFVHRKPGFNAESIRKFYDQLEEMERTYRTARLPLKGREVDSEVIARAKREGILEISSRGEVQAGDVLQDFRDTQQYLRALQDLIIEVRSDRERSPQKMNSDINKLEAEAIREVQELLARHKKTPAGRPPFGTRQAEARP